MDFPIQVQHMTVEDCLDEILTSGKLLPKSCLADMARFRWCRVLFLLPKSFSEKGLYGIIVSEIYKWEKDTRVWDYVVNSWIPRHSKKSGNLVKFTFELAETDEVYVLDESVLFAVAKKVWDSSFFGKWKIFFLEWKRVFTEYVKTKVRIEDYKGDYALPVVFIQNEIPTSRVNYEIISRKAVQ